LVKVFGRDDLLDISKSLWSDNYVFGVLSKETIGSLSSWSIPVAKEPVSSSENPIAPTGKPDTAAEKPVLLIHKIWLDKKIHRFVYQSRRTVKCDAALSSFAADGKDVVWAVADSGIDGKHPHFKTLGTLILPHGLMHMDFTQPHPSDKESNDAALTDQDGHGTHVAGIIAGMTCLKDKAPGSVAGVDVIKIRINKINDKGLTDAETITRDEAIFGLAPYCKILSLKVLRLSDESDLSNLLTAIGYIQKANDNGRHIKVHGVNLSLGYTLNAEWFAAGQSPLCVEVDRLVRSGVCVVVAAGNAGYGTVASSQGASEQAAHLGTISDPGNAALAITVGSTHRDLPHSYGISYFSGKGPTSDGRMKPDLVAPGERIVSCALVDDESAKNNVAPFRVDSGTSMAAPHVSGAVAAFLSVRGEFKGRPEDVKDILVQAATDLKRRPEFQGGGMLDLMRALQSV
jgi:serine protease AprX